MKVMDTDFDDRFDNGESIMPYADLPNAVRPNTTKRERMLSRLADMTDEEVLRRAESDPDCRPRSEEQLARMVPLRERSSAKAIKG